MILFNASTSNGLRNYTRFLTNTNTTTYSNADLDAALNMYYHQFVNEILSAQDDWDFNGEVATADLVAGQQEYVFPTDILKIKSIEYNPTGTKWYKLFPLDKSEIGTATDSTTISQNFYSTKPYYDLMDESLFLYPIPTTNVTGGLKIHYAKEAVELSAVTDEPVFAKAYHKGLCYGAAMDWFEKYLEIEGNAGKRDRQEKNLTNTIEKMREFYNTKHQDREYTMGSYDADMDTEYGYDY